VRSLPTLTRLQIVEALPGEHGQPIVVHEWMRDLLAALDNPAIVLLLLLLTRQSGKSTAMLHSAVSELFCRRGAYVVYAAAAEHQASAVYERKLRGPLTAFLKGFGIERAVKFTRRGVKVPALASELEILAHYEATNTGRTPTLFIADEARDISDAVFTALVPSIIGVGGKVFAGSSAGRPRGWFYELLKQPPAEEVWRYASAENLNPHASKRVLDFLRRRVGALFPAAMRRELENDFVEDGDELIPAGLVDAAVDDTLGEVAQHDGEAFGFLDLSRRRDLTTRVVIVRVGPRQPEAREHLLVVSIRTWNPRQQPTGEVPYAEVREDLASLPTRFPGLRQVLVDTGAESGDLLQWARQQPGLSIRVEGFTPSVTANMDLWGSLLGRLHARTISLPHHDRLLAELRGLRKEEFSFGSKWRVVDSSRKLHRDVSLSLAGACFAAGQEAAGMSPEMMLRVLAIGKGTGPGSVWADEDGVGDFYRDTQL
jgi:hypothetical protein